MLLVKQINNNTVDVFIGKGWTQWSRFEIVRNHGRLTLKLIKGQPMPKESFQQLYKVLS